MVSILIFIAVPFLKKILSLFSLKTSRVQLCVENIQ
jgi:hypothetical protein